MMRLEGNIMLPNHVKVHPGHGRIATIGKERAHNPFFHGKGEYVSWDTIIEEFY